MYITSPEEEVPFIYIYIYIYLSLSLFINIPKAQACSNKVYLVCFNGKGFMEAGQGKSETGALESNIQGIIWS